MEKLNSLSESDIKTGLLEKAEYLKTNGTVDGIESFMSTSSMIADALSWIDEGMDDVYINRIMNMLVENDMSAESVAKAESELQGFYTLGRDAKEKWEQNCGEEYTISDEELDKPLYERALDAIKRAKAKIDSNDGKDYKMLKELVSYMSGKYQYAGYENSFGMNADNCEIIVSNINFTLSNLEKIESGELKTELSNYNSGEMWLDTLGSKISAHGGQIIKQGDTYDFMREYVFDGAYARTAHMSPGVHFKKYCSHTKQKIRRNPDFLLLSCHKHLCPVYCAVIIFHCTNAKLGNILVKNIRSVTG